MERLATQAKHFESSWFNTNYKAIRFPAKDKTMFQVRVYIYSNVSRKLLPLFPV